jgi:hypothetical protein
MSTRGKVHLLNRQSIRRVSLQLREAESTLDAALGRGPEPEHDLAARTAIDFALARVRAVLGDIDLARPAAC